MRYMLTGEYCFAAKSRRSVSRFFDTILQKDRTPARPQIAPSLAHILRQLSCAGLQPGTPEPPQRRFLMFEAGFMSGETHDEWTEVRAPTVGDDTERGI